MPFLPEAARLTPTTLGKESPLRTLLTALAILAFASPTWAASHAGSFTMSFDLSSQPVGKEVRLWVPYPVSDVDQQIGSLSYSGNFTEAAVYTDRSNQTPMLYARWDAAQTERKLTLRFRAERNEVEHRDLPATETAWDRADYAAYLGATSLGPVDGSVKALADEITAGKTGVAAKARAIYDWICDNMFRDPKTRGCGLGDVNALLQSKGGKCADIHSVYVALARAAGVPAREVFGLRQAQNEPTDVTTWYHCWAEFYLPGYGWVPVDPGDVRKMMLTQNLALEDAKTAEYRRYFWGGIDNRRIKLSLGRDLTLNPPQSGGPVNYLMYPYAEVDGQALDWLDPERFVYRISWEP